MADPIRILLVDDDPMVRRGLRSILETQADLAVVGEVEDGDQVVTLVHAHCPDVVLMDVRMNRMDGLAATAALQSLPRPPHVVVMTTWDVDEYVVRAVEAGAAGFLLKTAKPLDIIQAVRSVVDGDAVLSRSSTRQFLQHYRSGRVGIQRSAAAEIGALSAREREMAIRVGQGMTNQEIADLLFISAATVKTTISSAARKLGVRDRIGIAVMMERAGLLPWDS